MAGDLVERLNALAERQCNARGDYLYKGQADPEITEAAARIAALEAEVGRLQRARDRYREQWENEKRRFAETIAALGETP